MEGKITIITSRQRVQYTVVVPKLVLEPFIVACVAAISRDTSHGVSVFDPIEIIDLGTDGFTIRITVYSGQEEQLEEFLQEFCQEHVISLERDI